MAIKEPIDEVQIARATTPRTHREITRQMRLSARRERRDFLVPDMNPVNLALPSYRVGKTVKAISNDSVDPLDRRGSKDLCKLS